MLLFSVLFSAFLGGFVQAVTGIGCAFFLMMVLPYYFNMLKSPAICGAIATGLTLYLVFKYRKHIQLRVSLIPSIFYVCVSILTIRIAGGLDLEILSLAFGIFMVALSIYFAAFNSKIHLQPTFISAAVCGSVAGICAGLFSIGGPPLSIYFLAATDTKEHYMANTQFVFALSYVATFATRIASGIYIKDLVPITLIGLIAMLIGMALGIKLLNRINISLMRKLVYVFIAVCGLSTIYNYFH